MHASLLLLPPPHNYGARGQKVPVPPPPCVMACKNYFYMFTYFCSQELFDYECDSDLEWEEEEPGESLSSHSGVSAVVSVILPVSFCVCW